MGFTAHYSMFSKTQKYQNAKLFKIMFEKLKESGWVPQKILDVGCGDGMQTLYLAKQFPNAKVIGIDLSEALIEKAKFLAKRVYQNVMNIEFIRADYFDFEEQGFDVVVSNNTFHWFGDKAVEGYKKLSYHLKFGGWFFIHQGGRWSYIALRYLMEKMLRERGIEPPPYPLFYPTKRAMEYIISSLPLVGKVEKVYEKDYDDKQVYIDFTYAGGLPYIELLNSEEEKEEFRKEFVKRCIEEECPAFPVRLYIYGRNIAGVFYKHFVRLPERFEDQVKQLLQEVDNEFVPPLSARKSSTQMKLEGSSTYSIDDYYRCVLSQENILALYNEHVIGLLSFIKEFTFEGEEWIYVSTIAVKKLYRGLKVGRGLYATLLSLYPSKSILTRTWTGNNSHIRILESLGFKEIKRIKDHRGKGIDTIYLGLKR